MTDTELTLEQALQARDRSRRELHEPPKRARMPGASKRRAKTKAQKRSRRANR